MTVQHKDLTAAELHEPKGVASASAGEAYVADGAGSGTWQGFLATALDLTGVTNGDYLFSNAGTLAGVTLNNANLVHLSFDYDDIAGVVPHYTVAPVAGVVEAIWTVINGATDVDTVITTSINGVNITSGTVTIATAGSAAGIRDSATPSGNNTVAAGDNIGATSDGAGTTVTKATIVVRINVA